MTVHTGGAARTTPAPDRLHLLQNVPKTIALQYANGKQVRSPKSGGYDMMYTLTTGERWFCPLEVASAIEELGIEAGEPFSVCLRGKQYEVNRLQQPRAPQAQNPQQSYRPAPPPPPAAPAPPPLKMNGNGQDLAEILYRCYQPAIEIALRVAGDAREKGLMIAPTFEDIRTIATTLFIQECK